MLAFMFLNARRCWLCRRNNCPIGCPCNCHKIFAVRP